MAGGYEDKPDGTEGVGGVLKSFQRQIGALRGGAGIRSAILRAVALVFQNEDGDTIGTFGTFSQSAVPLGTTDRVADVAQGVTFRNLVTGQRLLTAVTYKGTGTSEVSLWADTMLITGNYRIQLLAGEGIDMFTGGSLKLFNLPTTGSAANLHQNADGVHQVTSSARYKTDIAAADVDPADVLALSGRTWVDKGSIDRDEPGDLRRNVGFIAEELDEHPSLRQFVNYNDDGDPESIEYDRLTVALLAVLKDQQARIDDHEDRLTRLESGAK